jgi:hypothetical protein
MKTMLILLLLTTTVGAVAQQTVFTVMQGPAKLGDKEFERGEYKNAIELYKNSIGRDPGDVQVLSKLAQCYCLTRDHKNCVETYDSMTKHGAVLTWNDMFRYAEAQSAMENYSSAISWYKRCLDQDRDNELVSKKIWALSNIQFLLEDSSHYSIKPVTSVNTRASELGATLFGNAIVFTSNRKGTRPVDMASDDPNGPFFELYITEWEIDSVSNEKTLSKKPSRFGKSLGLKYNAGPIAFYDHRKKMVFVASAQMTGENGARALGLYFAELNGSRWLVTSEWPHNSDRYSITDVTINQEGTLMYLSSDMKGGVGGKDIYTSAFADGSWSRPTNIGSTINTTRDEVSPYLHRNGTLYFSSDGLPGMGGLDIFLSTIKRSGYSEPENIGYPINSHGDDFGLTFDSLATHGYFTSNRVNGGLDDDIYEFTMDLQTYPFDMTGVLRYKEHTWSDTLDIHEWPNAKLDLIDTWQDLHVEETRSGADGSFTLTIPYLSRYHILVTDEKGNQHKASLELEKYRTETYRYEIVVVKDLFAELKEREK